MGKGDIIMLEVNTKVMFRSDLDHRQAHNGQIGIVTKLYDTPKIPSKYFEVTLNKEHLGEKIIMAHETELVTVTDLEMPVEPVDPEQMKKWTAAARERAKNN